MKKPFASVLDQGKYIRYYFGYMNKVVKRIEFKDQGCYYYFDNRSLNQPFEMQNELMRYFLAGKAKLTKEGKDFLSL
jgi:hypothetical protein